MLILDPLLSLGTFLASVMVESVVPDIGQRLRHSTFLC
jgi:hypothetical protein